MLYTALRPSVIMLAIEKPLTTVILKLTQSDDDQASAVTWRLSRISSLFLSQQILSMGDLSPGSFDLCTEGPGFYHGFPTPG